MLYEKINEWTIAEVTTKETKNVSTLAELTSTY